VLHTPLLGRANLQHAALAHDGNAARHGHVPLPGRGSTMTQVTPDLFNDVDQLELGLLTQLFVQSTQTVRPTAATWGV